MTIQDGVAQFVVIDRALGAMASHPSHRTVRQSEDLTERLSVGEPLRNERSVTDAGNRLDRMIRATSQWRMKSETNN